MEEGLNLQAYLEGSSVDGKTSHPGGSKGFWWRSKENEVHCGGEEVDCRGRRGVTGKGGSLKGEFHNNANVTDLRSSCLQPSDNQCVTL